MFHRAGCARLQTKAGPGRKTSSRDGWFRRGRPGRAGPADRARRPLPSAPADIVIWASSLVDHRVLDHARPDAEIVDSAQLPLEGVLPCYERAARGKLTVARVHSGDPSLWGAVQEQLELCDELGLDTEIVPGVSSFTAVAAAVGRELTIPEVAQSVILTRLGGGKTPMPAGEQVSGVRPARHHDGAVPVGRPLRPAPGRAARRAATRRTPRAWSPTR